MIFVQVGQGLTNQYGKIYPVPHPFFRRYVLRNNLFEPEEGFGEAFLTGNHHSRIGQTQK